MDCKNFGIGLIVLSITLFLGITISETLGPDETSKIAVKEVVLKDCVAADPDLKHHFTGDGETKTVSRKVENVDELKKLLDGGEIYSESEKQLKKIEKEAERHNSSFQTLVFVRKCRSEKESE